LTVLRNSWNILLCVYIQERLVKECSFATVWGCK